MTRYLCQGFVMFYFWLSVEIVIVSKEFFKILNPDQVGQ